MEEADHAGGDRPIYEALREIATAPTTSQESREIAEVAARLSLTAMHLHARMDLDWSPERVEARIARLEALERRWSVLSMWAATATLAAVLACGIAVGLLLWHLSG